MSKALHQVRLTVMEEIAHAWNEAHIRYGVVHGLEGYPVRLGRDLDVLVKPEDSDKALIIALEVFKDHGWMPTIHRKPWAVWLIAYRFARDHVLSVEVDLFSTIQWGFSYLIMDGPLDVTTEFSRGPFQFDPWGSLVKRVLMQVLGGKVNRLEGRPSELEISAREEAICRERLVRLFGSESTERLLSAVRSRDFCALRGLTYTLKASLMSRAFRGSPSVLAKAVIAWTRNKLSLNVCPTPAAPIISVVGPDGVGKTTVLGSLQGLLTGTLSFAGCARRHWRPRLLPPLGQIVGNQGTSGEGDHAPRRSPGKFGTLRALYYALDFIVGYWLLDRRDAARLKGVLYDRHALDMYVDPVRFGLKSFPLTLMRFIPQPNLIFLLVDEPTRIIARKPELLSIEISSQYEIWHKLQVAGYPIVNIVVEGTPETIAQRITHYIANYLVERERQR